MSYMTHRRQDGAPSRQQCLGIVANKNNRLDINNISAIISYHTTNTITLLYYDIILLFNGVIQTIYYV